MDKDPAPVANSAERESLEVSSEAHNEAVTALGSRFHEEWRKSRLNEDGTFEPRLKSTKDQDWIDAHGGQTEVDIANTSYEDLPSDWQADNKAAAEAVVGIIDQMGGEVNLDDPDTYSQVGNAIHDDWLSRNGAWAPEEQKLPFDELSQAEKDKDIQQMWIAKKVFGI